MKVILIELEHRFDEYGDALEIDSMSVNKIENVEITEEEFNLLRKYYNTSFGYRLVRLVENSGERVELDIQKALAKEKKGEAEYEKKNKEAIAKKKAAAKKRKEKQLEKAREVLKKAGEL